MGRFYNPNLPALDFGYRPTQTSVDVRSTDPLTKEKAIQLKKERIAKEKATATAQEVATTTKVEFTDDPEMVPKGTIVDFDQAKYDEIYAIELQKTHPELAKDYTDKVQKIRQNDVLFKQAQTTLSKAQMEHKYEAIAQATQFFHITKNEKAALHILNSSLSDLGEDPVTAIRIDKNGSYRYISKQEPEGFAMSPYEADRNAIGSKQRQAQDTSFMRLEERKSGKKPPNVKVNQTEIDAETKSLDTYIKSTGNAEQKAAWEKAELSVKKTMAYDIAKQAKYLQHYYPEEEPLTLHDKATKQIVSGLSRGETWTKWIPNEWNLSRNKSMYESPLGTPLMQDKPSATEESSKSIVKTRTKGASPEGMRDTGKVDSRPGSRQGHKLYIKGNKLVYEDSTEAK